MMFHSVKEERMKIYENVLGLQTGVDLLEEGGLNGIGDKKYLKYSLSTVRNYMNVVMN